MKLKIISLILVIFLLSICAVSASDSDNSTTDEPILVSDDASEVDLFPRAGERVQSPSSLDNASEVDSVTQETIESNVSKNSNSNSIPMQSTGIPILVLLIALFALPFTLRRK